MQASRPSQPRPIRRLIIAGGGTAGWMSAAMLSKSLGRLMEIILVESDEIGTVGVGEATIPTMINFHKLLELDEAQFMAATNATFKLGISFENWRAIGEHYIHSFGETGIDHWTAGFQHFWHKGRERGLAGGYGDYCLELRAAQKERFAHLPDDGLNYAYHLDAGAYARFLRRFSEGFGVRRVEGKIGSVNTDPESGHIASLTLADGSVLEGDFFIDCTGFRSLLLGGALGVPYEDWSELLLCDSALAVQTESTERMVPYTRSIAHGGGWQWQIPLQTRVGNGLVYSSRYLDDDSARETLLGNLDSKPLFEPRLIRFKPGQRAQTWKANCVAFGLSSGFLEPIESTSIHLISRNLIRLMQLFPTDGISAADIEEYNRQVSEEMVHIRDFIILHYHLNERQEPLWRACREMEVPATLRHRLELFGDTGRVFREQKELFAENSWIQVMLGQGLIPASHHRSADLMPDHELKGFLDSIRTRVDQLVAQLPPHKDYVRRYCGS
ncbi:tryptophan halogenase family protein [Massilia endophytica]|uniref:tryptophan halogenase family protein n=1 Tax=Massilia endophytica TaxID=2899220 RepID=UPI001E478E79|nr:tryptophan halogenase family protein [Massilia endophytica]UGQ46520.1 tryptophan 7-halogenase [Massilia endophytica]